jgi:hypothetical protein
MPGEFLHIPEASADLGHFARGTSDEGSASRVRRTPVHRQGGREPMEPQAHRRRRQPTPGLQEDDWPIWSHRVPALGLERNQRRMHVGVHRHRATAGLALTGAVLQVNRLRNLPFGIGDHGPVSEAMALARRPALIDNRKITRSRYGERVVSRYPTRVRSCVGLTILACLPCMVAPPSPQCPNSYYKSNKAKKCYQLADASRQIVRPTRPTAGLIHKIEFPYEYLYACMCMPLHAVHAWSMSVLPTAPCTKRQACSQGLASGKPRVASL